MFFKNAKIFRLTSDLGLFKDQLNDLLKVGEFIPCTGLRPASFGWVFPAVEGEFAHEIAGATLFKAKYEQKVIPPSALNDVLEEKVKHFEDLEGRPIRSKERQSLKQDALAELLPRSLPKSITIHGFVSIQDKLLVIDTASNHAAELFISCLRECLGSLALHPPQVTSKPSAIMTASLAGNPMEHGISLRDTCDLLDPEEGSTVTFRHGDLATRELRIHLEAGKICQKVGMRYQDISFTCDKDLGLTQIKHDGFIDATDDDDPVGELDAAFATLVLELRQLIPALFKYMGGEHSG